MNQSSQEKLSYLLDRQGQFNQEKVNLLDQLTVAISQNSPDSKDAHEIWRYLKEDHYFWYHSSTILKMSQVNETKVFILVILEDAIKQKWYVLPQDQRNQIKEYIVGIVLEYGAIDNISGSLRNILSKVNSVLVQIVKYEWNTTWKSFINDICAASTKDMNICENNFYVLKMLSEEIFDYSKNQMTQQQISELKTQMNSDFTTIFQLCKLILENTHQAKQSLVKACLETLNAFLSWIPMYYIIYTNLIEKLIEILPSDYLRNHALSCLVEIAGLQLGDAEEEKIKFMMMLKCVTLELNKLIPLSEDDDSVQKMLGNIKRRFRSIFEILARGISMFYSEFFKHQHSWLTQATVNNPQYISICQMGFKYLLMMMKIDEDQVFKIVIEFFHMYIGRYLEEQHNPQISNNYMKNKMNCLESVYDEIFTEVMHITCLKMAKPEEVLIVIDEDGLPVREHLENTENISLYEIMKELASYLVKYNWEVMKKFIINETSKQLQEQHFSFETLNSLSWVVGSLCGAILEKEEKNFFISTLKILLQLCENKKGKDNKAVIASCIMYVVGQYPTFLRNNWNFLKTVIRKLFEFMREEFPGIMQMACNAFLKISKTTADHFVIVHSTEHEAYIREVVRKLPEETKKLSRDLQLVFYESVGYMIAAEQNSSVQLQLIRDSLGAHLYEFENIIQMAQTNQNILKEEETERRIIFFLKLNEMLATGVGQQYVIMLELLSETMNKLYLYYSEEVSNMVKQNGKNILNYMTVRAMRSIKKDILKVYIRFLEKCNSLNGEKGMYILEKFIIPLGALLKDFQDGIAETKEQEFVALFTVVLEKLHFVLDASFISKLLDMIFSSSLPLITSDFNSFPEIRASFFAFLKALIKFNFNTLYALDESQFMLILDCVIWSFKHELCTYSDLGLELLDDILANVNKCDPQVLDAFYAKYYLKIVTNILDVMTDGLHKSGLDFQSKIFFILIRVLAENIVISPVSSDQGQQPNGDFIYSFLIEKLSQNFPNISRNVTMEKVSFWFKQSDEKMFKLEIADYLILLNRYTPQEIQESDVKGKPT